MKFPLIYCNGCSYSDENVKPFMKGNAYSNHLGKLLQGYTINNAKAGSCNRRILRSATHDLLLERQHNPDQKIIALIQLTFELRDELWIDDIGVNDNKENEVESNFRTHQFSYLNNWKELLLSGKDIKTDHRFPTVDKKFLDKWSAGRAYFYNSYAERINLLLDLVFFITLMKAHNIDYLIFAGPIFQKLESEYLIDFFKLQLEDPRMFDLEKFGFCEWCNVKGFNPLTEDESRSIGHYGPDAHQAFAEQVILPKLKDLGII